MSIYFSHVEYCRVMDVFFRALKLHKHLLIIIIIIIIIIIVRESEYLQIDISSGC